MYNYEKNPSMMLADAKLNAMLNLCRSIERAQAEFEEALKRGGPAREEAARLLELEEFYLHLNAKYPGEVVEGEDEAVSAEEDEDAKSLRLFRLAKEHVQ